MPRPKVSVVIPVYNTSRYLVRCLSSVMNQTLQDMEVVIVNDGSTDDSEVICNNYITNNNLDWTLLTKPNGGLSSARHYGWQKSNGECIVFVDSDDELLPDYCKLLYESMAETQSQLAICGYNRCDSVTQGKHLPDFDSNVVEDVLVNYGKRIIVETPKQKKLPGFLWMRMMRRDLITNECFVNENEVFSEDQVFDLEYCKNVKRITVVDKALYNYFINPGSLTLKYRPNMMEMIIQLNAYSYNFLESNVLLDEETKIQLVNSTVQGIISSAINALRFGKYKDIITIVDIIKADERTQKAFDYLSKHSRLSRKQRVWKTFLNKYLIGIPYLYYSLK